MTTRHWLCPDPSHFTMKLKYYYDHSREWWEQAIWYYNKFNNADVRPDMFDVVEKAGVVDDMAHNDQIDSLTVLSYWEQHQAAAAMLLPER
jgi:hypothetical protein